ncbi:MAG TPA: trigger factor [Gemmatimonadetes bacterium]|nr:trigger factor [Gemmatimonadota bacterium]HBD99530.1 trigger factor [Gemmatimonadota bacterium]HIC53169.1 trigger factor [Gemmatimonadota bacterium]HIN52218.1 trigger factor [Gemmatimonadota bacterium]
MTVDASSLQVSVEEQERWRRSMSVTVPASVVQQEERRAAKQLASRARLKGFRKGRVPAKVIESRFGGTLRKEALDKLVGEAYRTALAAQDLTPISEGEIQELSYEPEQDLVFSISFDIQPQIEIGRLGGFAIERPVAEVNDEHVDKVLARIQEQNGAWKPVAQGQPEDRDLVAVRIKKVEGETTDEGKEYEFLLGQGDALPDIETAIKSLEAGASGEFDVAFPEDSPDKARRGETERVHITLVARKVQELPELDDALAKQVGDFETLDNLKTRVREDLDKEAGEEVENVVRGRLLDMLLDANPFEVPASMVDRYADGVIGEQPNLDPERLEEIRASIRVEAERAVKRILIIEKVADTQGLAATEDDIDARVEEIAEANASTAAKVYASLQKAGRLEMLERELTERKVFDFLKEQSEIIDSIAP